MRARPLHAASVLLVTLLACSEPAPRVTPEQHAEGLYLKSQLEYHQGKFTEALGTLATVRRVLPADPRLPAAEGEVHLAMGQLKEAAADFEAALEKEPRRATTWSRLGYVRAQLGETEAAMTALRRAVALFPEDEGALALLGELHQRREEPDEAVRHFQLAARAATPETRAALLLRAQEVRVGQGRLEEARVLLEEAAQVGVRDASLLAALGELQVRTGALEAATASYTEAARKSPNDPTLWEVVGELHLRQDKPGDALLAFRESLRVKERTRVHVAVARIQLARQERRAAQESLEHALAVATGRDAGELQALAQLLADLGRKPDALKLLTQLAAEPGQEGDVALQRRTARLARELGERATASAACARVRKADARAACP